MIIILFCIMAFFFAAKSASVLLLLGIFIILAALTKYLFDEDSDKTSQSWANMTIKGIIGSLLIIIYLYFIQFQKIQQGG